MPKIQPPTFQEKLTIKEQKKARREAFYKINAELTQTARSLTSTLGADKLEEILSAYVSLMGDNGEKPETTEVQSEVLQQMALLAGVSLSRIITERYK